MTEHVVRSTDHAGLVVLSPAECFELAASQPVGRIGFADDGKIEILPVNHLIVGRLVAFRTAGGSKLAAAFERAAVSFEVDSYDADRHTGWSVLIKGRAELVNDQDTAARLPTTGLPPWPTSVARAHWVVIRPDLVSGRRL